MRHLLIRLAILQCPVLLCPALPALAQVTVDLHALEGLPSAPDSAGRRAAPSAPQAEQPSISETQPTTHRKRRSVAGTQQPAHGPGVVPPKPSAGSSTAAAPPPTGPAPAAPPPTGSASTGSAPTGSAPTSAVASTGPTAPASSRTPSQPPGGMPSLPASGAAPPGATAPTPPAATLSAAPPPVASLTPIQPPVPPANAPPPPAPPIAAGAATTAAATQSGMRLNFAKDQSDLSPVSAESIKHFVQAAPTGDATTFNVLAYATGDPDDPSVARRLSLARAIAVRAALMADGVPSSRVYLRALGSEPGQGPADRVDLSVLGGNAGVATGQR